MLSGILTSVATSVGGSLIKNLFGGSGGGGGSSAENLSAQYAAGSFKVNVEQLRHAQRYAAVKTSDPRARGFADPERKRGQPTQQRTGLENLYDPSNYQNTYAALASQMRRQGLSSSQLIQVPDSTIKEDLATTARPITLT